MWEPAIGQESKSTPKPEAGFSTRGGPPSAKKDYFIKGNSSKHYLLLIITISSYSASSNCHFSCPSSGLLHRPCNAETQHTEQTLLLKCVWAEWLNNQIHIAFNSYIEFSCRTCQVEKKKNYEKVKFSTVSQEDFLPLQCILLSPLHLNQKFFLLLTM